MLRRASEPCQMSGAVPLHHQEIGAGNTGSASSSDLPPFLLGSAEAQAASGDDFQFSAAATLPATNSKSFSVGRVPQNLMPVATESLALAAARYRAAPSCSGTLSTALTSTRSLLDISGPLPDSVPVSRASSGGSSSSSGVS